MVQLGLVEGELVAFEVAEQVFLDAIGQELAGNPRYASDPKVDAMRAAAERLLEELAHVREVHDLAEVHEPEEPRDQERGRGDAMGRVDATPAGPGGGQGCAGK